MNTSEEALYLTVDVTLKVQTVKCYTTFNYSAVHGADRYNTAPKQVHSGLIDCYSSETETSGTKFVINNFQARVLYTVHCS